MGNDDRLYLSAGETATPASIPGAGTVVHIWITIASEHAEPEQHFLRKLVLRAFWDGEETPGIEVPVGDFFRVGHAQRTNFVSLPLQMSPQDRKGFNCWFPMPFSNGAHFEVHYDSDKEILFYYTPTASSTTIQERLMGLGASMHHGVAKKRLTAFGRTA